MQVLVRRRRAVTGMALSALAVGLLQVVPVVAPAAAGTRTTAVSTASGASAPSDGGSTTVALSADGRYAAFVSAAALVPEDRNGSPDVYRKDLLSGTVVPVSVTPDDRPTGGARFSQVDVNDDGDVVVFRSHGYTPSEGRLVVPGIYHHRLSTGTVTHVDAPARVLTEPSFFSVSGDGDEVVYLGDQDRLSDAPNDRPVYLRDLASSDVVRVADGLEGQVAISGDGTKVVYRSTSFPPPGSGCSFCLVRRDLSLPAWPVRLVNGDTSSGLADPAGLLGPDAVSRTGDQVAFWTEGNAHGSGPGTVDSNGVRDVYVSDLATGAVRRASVTVSGAQVTGESAGPTHDSEFSFEEYPKGAISADGGRVAFSSAAELVPGVTGGSFVKDMGSGAVTAASLTVSDQPVGLVHQTTMSADGGVVSFVTDREDVVAGDNNESTDVFARTLRQPLNGFTLSVVPPVQRAGVSELDTNDIDVALLPVAFGGLESAPLRSSPLRSSPLRSSPLRSSPLRSSPVPIPLSTVPVFLDGGWAPLLVGTPYEGAALQAVTLQEVLSLTPPTGNAGLDALTLADIDITSTPLRSSPLQAFLYGGVALSQLTASAQSHCDDLPASIGCTPASTLEQLVAAGATPSQLGFVSGLLVADADLTGTVMHQYDIGSVDVERLGMADFSVESLPAGMVDPLKCLAPCDTLGEAIAADALSEDYALTRLGRVLDQDRPETGSLRLGDLIRAVVDPAQLSYADVDLDRLVAQAPFDPDRYVRYTAQADVACSGIDGLTLRVALPAGFRYVAGSTTLRSGGKESPYADPTADEVVVDRASASADVPAEVRRGAKGSSGPRLVWDGIPCDAQDSAGTLLGLSFDVSPGVELGDHTSSASLVAYAVQPDVDLYRDGEHDYRGSEHGSREVVDSAAVDDAAPVTVEDAFDSGPRPASLVEPTIPVVRDHLYVSHISSPTDVDVYELPAGLPAGTRVTAVLSHLPADFDLFLDGPTAAPLRSSPLRSSPLRSSPIEDLDVPGEQGGDVVEAETLQDVPVRSSVLSQSATAGTEDEQVTTVLTKASTAEDPVTVAVTHHLGSSHTSPYLLQFTVEDPVELECPAPGPTVPFAPPTGGTGTPGTLRAVDSLTEKEKATTQALFVVNQKRLGDAFGAVAAQDVMTELETLADRKALPGLVLAVEGRLPVAESYASWDAARCDPEAANDVVRAIGAVIDEYAAVLPALRYITFVGDDDILPFARVPDGATVSNQRDYHPEVKLGGADNPISAAYGRGYVLTDNVLLAKEGLDFLGHQLPVPHYAGGRLVETPSEIIGTIRQYLDRPYIVKDRTVITGYDFLKDLSPVLHKALTGADAPTGDTPEFLNSETWTRGQLRDSLGTDAADDGPTVAAINAHFDHSNALPAAGNAVPSPSAELFSSADLRDSGLPPGSYLMSLGCQSGLSVPGRAWAAAATDEEKARLDDFAQVLAQKRAGGFFAPTGFGYGDDVLLAYSERLLELFTENLDGTMTVGQAATKAKQQYLEDGLVGVYGEKVINEATSYGLPFLTVGPTGTAAATPAVPAPGTAPTETLFGTPVRSASTGDITYSPPSATDRGTYYAIDGEQPLVEHWRPVQPAIQEPLPAAPAGSIIGDVWFTGLRSLPDVGTGTFDPVFSAPTVDAGSSSPEPLVRSIAFPVSLGTVTPRGTLALFPGQYRSGDVPGRGTQLLFDRMDYKVFYPTEETGERPTFTSVQGTAGDNGTVFRVGITGAEGAAVLAKPVTSPTWVEVPLTQSSPGVWTGATGLLVSEYLVQSVKDGRVATTRAKGLDYSPTPQATDVSVEPVGPIVTPTNAPWSRQPVRITSTAPDVEASVDGGAFELLPLTISGDGVHEVRHRRVGDPGTSLLLVPIDATPPTATITHPPVGGTVSSADRTARFDCADATSGVASCTPLDSTTLLTTPGTHTFRVRVRDHAGATETATATYRGTDYVFEGFFAPVNNAPAVNVVQPGSTVPVKFRLLHEGVVVTDPSAVTSIATTTLASCPNPITPNPEETAPTPATGSLVHDATAKRFHYNWRTARTAQGCAKLIFTFQGGSSQHALFRFK